MNDAQQSPQVVHLRQPTVMLSDLTDDLLWPKLLRAPALAMAPSRLVIGSIGAFLLSLVLSIAAKLTTGGGRALDESGGEIQQIGDRFAAGIGYIQTSVRSFDFMGLAHSIGFLAVVIRDAVMGSPLVSLLLGLPLIMIVSVVGGAMSRSTAIEFSQGRYASSDDTVGFALRRTRQLTMAVVGPIVLCVGLFLLIAVGGLVLSVPVLDVFGAVLYGIALLLGGLATVVLMLHIVALPMIVPALSIEGTDAFDAIQRSYAYVIGKPLRYLLSALVLSLVGVLSLGVFTLVASGVIEMTDWAASFFAADSTSRVLSGQGELGATKGTAHAIVSIWRLLVELLVAGYALSLFYTSSTLLYLASRRVCDGQDINEIWNGQGE